MSKASFLESKLLTLETYQMSSIALSYLRGYNHAVRMEKIVKGHIKSERYYAQVQGYFFGMFMKYPLMASGDI